MDRNPRLLQVFGLGPCSLDYIAKVQAYPPPDVKFEFSELVIQGGGPVATALVALARWGVFCAYVGVVGDDLFGTMIRTSLEGEQIDITGLLIRQGFASQFAFIAAEPIAGRRTIFWRRSTGSPPSPQEINFRLVREARVVHTDGFFQEAARAVCQEARKAGGLVVVDAGSLREGILDVARLSDCFIASEPFATALVGKNNPLEACRKVADLGPRIVGVTLGSKGYVAWIEGKVIQRSAYSVEAVDTTGCGDVFHAGVIYGLIQGWKADQSLDFAAWSAAMVSRKMGGRSGIPTLREMAEQGYR